MSEAQEIELVFEPLEEGGFHAYAPDLPGLHTQGEDIDDATKTLRKPWLSTSRAFVRTAGRSTPA